MVRNYHIFHGKLRLHVLVILVGIAIPTRAQEYKIAFWNVENLYDTYRDTLILDESFTPQGEHHWTQKRYNKKLNDIFKVIVAMGSPDVMGLCEIENERVLQDLCMGTPLSRKGYKFIHYDSPERRGVDCALLYNPKKFHPINSTPIHIEPFATRDILEVEGVTDKGDTLILFICHMPSKLGGAEADQRRLFCAKILRASMDSLASIHPQATIIAMGDMNTSPQDHVFQGGLGFSCDNYLNLMANTRADMGSYCYQGQWEFIDQIIISSQGSFKASPGESFQIPIMMEKDEKHLTSIPFRTYRGPIYHGGISDHLPVFTIIKH